MNSKKIIIDLNQEFPDRKIIAIPEQNPLEIICEIDPSLGHPEKSIAIAVVDESEPHYHLKSRETYIIEKGKLILTVDGKEHLLEKGQVFVVEPSKLHFAKGSATRVRIESVPGWTKEDHYLGG